MLSAPWPIVPSGLHDRRSRAAGIDPAARRPRGSWEFRGRGSAGRHALESPPPSRGCVRAEPREPGTHRRSRRVPHDPRNRSRRFVREPTHEPFHPHERYNRPMDRNVVPPGSCGDVRCARSVRWRGSSGTWCSDRLARSPRLRQPTRSPLTPRTSQVTGNPLRSRDAIRDRTRRHAPRARPRTSGPRFR